MKEKPVKFGEALRRLRQAKKLTQDELAERIGKTTAAVGQYERGESGASYETMEKIINEFGGRCEPVV
jgi:transcriptional regulator with XRE-family HTH domain